MRMNYKNAVKAIDKEGALLVFPIKNKRQPLSLWQHFFPKTEMTWEWDEEGDGRVFDLWHLMKELSDSGDVVYSKWYLNRATFFSKQKFGELLSFLQQRYDLEQNLITSARDLLEVLRQDSPLSTRELKAQCELQGRINEGLYNKFMKQLYQRCLIVGKGEKDEGSFPSSMMGATELLFEDLYKNALKVSQPIESPFAQIPSYDKVLSRICKSLIGR